MASIRTNLQAGLISRQLSNINRRFTTNLERLSTGLRLNRPDDSPGQYGVVINQNLQIQSLNQGVINAQNAAGMLQTAEEGINTIIDVLNRAHDLAVTAADATLTSAQRQQAQDEVESLLTASDGSSEIQQILDNVNYNGVKLLAESQSNASVEGGAIGYVGGAREGTGGNVSGGEKQVVYADTIASSVGGSTSMFASNASGALYNKFNAVTQAGLTSVLTTANEAGMDISLSSTGIATGGIQKGDILELNVITADGTVSDQVIVSALNDHTVTASADIVTVFNAQGYDKALNLWDTLVAQNSGVGLTTTTASTTFSINRIPQTLILDSTGATAVSASSRNFNSTIATTNNLSSDFREVLHVGVALKAEGDTSSATLNRVSVSFSDTNALSAADKLESAIEAQLGGEYRKGGSLHIDVTAVADVYKVQCTAATGIDTTNSLKIAANAELTSDLWTDTQTLMGTGSMGVWTTTEVVGTEYADLRNVSFKFSTTSTAGVNQTPELRIMSDEMAGYTDVDKGRGRMFGNTLSIATGQHGNDKFMLTIDGEEVEVDLDGDYKTSTAQRVDTLVDELDKVTVDSVAASALNASVFRMGIGDTNATAGLTATTVTNFATGTSTMAGALYDLGNSTSRNYTGGYYSQDNLRTMLTSAINDARAAGGQKATATYDHATRIFSIITGSRSNLSNVKIGASVQTDITLDNGAKATNLIDTTPGTSGFIGALGLTEGSNSTGSGSDFEFRLGGGTDTYSIDFGTFGVTNMGADQTDLSNIQLSTQTGASSAITVIETALESISTTQTKIGAGINHMSRRVNVMESHREALRGAKARIEEIDFTVETRNLASLQILLQSSTAALAQANIIPQTLLQLLA